MNYLAHAYLSFNREEILVGNMISDFVKGIHQYEYDEEILKGIKLHRAIDNFTDEHSITREAAKVFKPAVGLYARAFLDVAFDHYLAIDENGLTEKEWIDFSLATYAVLFKHHGILPKTFQRILPSMNDHNWLYHYRFKYGVKNSFTSLYKRAKYLELSDAAYNAFEDNYDLLKDYYQQFFPLLKAFTYDQLLIVSS